MCGIFAYVGTEDTVQICLSGLKLLEYRGYDSAGIAGLHGGRLEYCKAAGKVARLEELLEERSLSLDMAIAHTRWATHGAPTDVNAHPQLDEAGTVAVVHNGIIENYDRLREMLKQKGAKFHSDTDTEVVAKLVASFYEGDFLKAVQQTLALLKGSYALAFIHKDHPGQIIPAAHQSPLALGLGNGEAFVASDPNAYLAHTRQAVFLHDGEVAVVRADGWKVFDSFNMPVDKEVLTLAHQLEDVSKGQYQHYTLKEIHEQPQTIRNALLSRYVEVYGNAYLEFRNIDMHELHRVERILILACGTSWHAGFVASYFFEDWARIPTQVEISSEFRYMNPIVADNTLAIAISQSGETADTLAALRELKAKGAHVIGICNVQGSTLAREADDCFFLRAGPEIGVCSTKAFTSQLTVLALLGLLLARMRDRSRSDGIRFLEHLEELPAQVEAVLKQSESIRRIATKYAEYNNFFFLGRRYMYPTALEGALKLKEISYINANGYPAGEMKHGPIALIDESCPTVAFLADSLTYEKMLSNLMEVKARGGPVIAIAEKGSPGLQDVADEVIWVPKTMDELSSIPSSVAAQLFSYYVALHRGAEIDQPRNLAKSVTVE